MLRETAREAGSAAAAADPARRLLAVRAARPLLRARADPRGVPPALRRSGACGPAARSCAEPGRAEPAPEQRGRRGRPAQRRDDRARRLRRRARPAAAPRRPADLLRARARRRGGPARRPAPSSARSSTASRAPRGAASCSSSPSRSGSTSRSSSTTSTTATRGQAERVAPTATSTCSRRRCSTSTTSRTSCGSSTSLAGVRAARRSATKKLARPEPLHGAASCERLEAARGAHRRARRRRRAVGARRTPTIGRIALDHLEQLPRHDPRGGRRGRPRRVRGRPGRRRRSSCAGYLDAYEMTERARSGSPTASTAARRSENGDDSEPTFALDLNTVRDGFARFGLLDDRVRFLQGAVAEHARRRRRSRRSRSCASTGATAEEIGAALEALYDRVVLGGFVVVDDYGRPTARSASTRSAPSAASSSRSSGSTGAAPPGARPSRPSRPHGDAAGLGPSGAQRRTAPAAGDQGPLGRRRLPQHAPRGGAHAALALARATSRASTTSTTR